MTIDSAFSKPQKLPVTQIQLPELTEKGIKLWLLRLDQTHPFISGNKWYKLKYNLEFAVDNGYRTVLSFGGAYSNHIHALAWAAKEAGLNSIGVIRGEPEYAANPTLSDAQEWGMQLKFVNRQDYRLRQDPDYIQQLCNSLPESLQPVLVIPEGGSNKLAVKGCREILSEQVLQHVKPESVILACGTGGTLSGVAVSQPSLNILGIPVLKNAEFLYDDIRNLIQSSGEADPQNWTLDLDGHFGGYAKCPQDLTDFMQRIESECGVPLDQVYTAKMLLRTLQMIKQDLIKPGSTLLALHTGGLQGRRSVYGSKN